MRRDVTILGLALASVMGAVHGGEAKPLQYPTTRRVAVVDDYHGTKVSDPYRWLEDDVRQSKEVVAWVEAQNKVTEGYLSTIPLRAKLRTRLTELWNFPRYSPPRKVAGRYFFSKNDGLQNQAVLATVPTLDAEPKVVLDPNSWSKDGTVALAELSFSDDSKYLAYAVADAGSDWTTWKVLNLTTLKPTEDEIHWSKHSTASWTRDGRGFFYSRFPQPKQGEAFQSVNLDEKVYYHRLGTSQSDDVLVYHRPDNPSWSCTASVTDDSRYLVLFIGDGTTSERSRIAYKDLNEPYGLPIDLIDRFEARYFFIDNDGPVFYFHTDYRAPGGRVIAIDIRKPAKEHWKEIIPEGANTIEKVTLVGNLIVVNSLQDAKTQVKMFKLDGTFVREVEFPGIGSAIGFEGKRTDTETFYTFSSFATPPSIYRHDLVTGKNTPFRRVEVKFDADEYEVKQIFYRSKDGARIPMFLAHKKGIKLDGNNPTLLYGYGGFNIAQVPTFSVARLGWMELGGVFALANLRGGAEYGEEWHRAGTKEKKQNVFDDFIAAAEWLIANKWTRPQKLAIQGRSNGGLLVGAVMAQRPELFGACLPAVGVMDMLRFHKFTAGRYWVDDYGSADIAEDFKPLFAYSPYHNLKKGIQYPPTLVTTADTDDRVVPGHSFKFIAKLQYCQAGTAPVLARIETRAGHGSGKPTSKLIDETTDLWAFLVKNLGMKLP